MSESNKLVNDKIKAARTLERIARNSRKYYDQKKDNPEFKQLLADRSRARRLKLKEAKTLVQMSAIVAAVTDVDAVPSVKLKESKKMGRPRKCE